MSTNLILYLLQISLSSENGFLSAVELTGKTSVKLAIWVTLICVGYHLIAGVKHLLLDLGFGETKTSAENAARILLLSLLMISVLAGVWVW